MSNLYTPFSTPPLDDAAERRIGELIEWALTNANGNVRGNAAYAIRQAWTEATEAAAMKCDSMRTNVFNNVVDRTHDRACKACAAAIRGGKL